MGWETYYVVEVGGCSSVSDVDVISSDVQVLVMERLMNVSDELGWK